MAEYASRLLPDVIDNAFPGHWVAQWAFVVVAMRRAIRAFVHFAYPAYTASSLAFVPLHTYDREAADTILSLYSLNGLAHLAASLLHAVVLLRYQSLVPLMYLLLLLELIAAKWVAASLPIKTQGQPPSAKYSVLVLPIIAALLGLSLA